MAEIEQPIVIAVLGVTGGDGYTDLTARPIMKNDGGLMWWGAPGPVKREPVSAKAPHGSVSLYAWSDGIVTWTLDRKF